MVEPDVGGWRKLAATSNTQYYEVEPGIIAAVPHPGSSDDERTARENVAYQTEYFRSAGRRGCALVFFDRMTSQDAGARRVYQSVPDPRLQSGTALIGGSLLGRAMASFFLGLSRTQVAVKLFGHLDEALAWARAQMGNVP